MEKLAQRLDACQEKMLQLIEQSSKLLEDQICYWDLVKTEQLLLHAARKHGQSRVGFEPVPPSKVTEQQAKTAMLMSMVLKTLKNSTFSAEDWTLPECSHEVFITEPSYCFKKQGQQVEVWFEGNEDNAVPYVQWGSIYGQNNDNSWYKVHGNVDYKGLYYEDPEVGKRYYVDFEKEAVKYGNSKPWLVQTTNGTIFPSSSCTATRDTNSPYESPHSSRGPSSESEAQLSFWGSYTGQLPHTRCHRRVLGEETDGQRSQEQAPAVGPRRRYRGGGEKRRRRGSPQQNFEKAAGGSREAAGRPSSRGGENTHQDCSYPVLIFSGKPNVLKCWRSRVTQGYRDCFLDFSTTFSWCYFGGGRGVDGRVIVTFNSHMQLKCFLDKVPRPKTVKQSKGHLAAHH